jgi:hypothetical protein
MSKRQQVLLDEAELRDLQDAARRQGVPVSEWVRQTLRDARQRQPQGSIDRKLHAVRSAARHEFPTADIDEMLAQIERGYGAQPPK